MSVNSEKGPLDPKLTFNYQGIEIPIPRDGRGRVIWKSFQNQPEQRLALIEEEAARYLGTGQPLTFSALEASQFSFLVSAIQRYYPHRIHGIQSKFGAPQSERPKKFWETEEGYDTLRQEVAQIAQQAGQISEDILIEHQRSDLANAVKKYPGKWRQLREDIGLVNKKKPVGFWKTFQTLGSWVEEFSAHPQWRDMSRNELMIDRLSGGAGFYQAFYKWVKRVAQSKEEESALIYALFPSARVRGLDKSSISSEEANQDLEKLLEVN
jgi:hypothetical protein